MSENFFSLPFMITGVILFSIVLLFFLSKDWKRLEELYRTNDSPPSNLKRFEYGSVGIANYRGSLCVGITQKGLYLSIVPILNFGLKPILIPWTAIQSIETYGIPLFKRVCLTVSSPSVKIFLRNDLLLPAKQYLPAHISNWEG